MEKKLSISQVKSIIENTKNSFPHKECASCECYLGFVTQLEILSDESCLQFLEKQKIDQNKIHSCLGCDPCPPGNHFAKFIRGNINGKFA